MLHSLQVMVLTVFSAKLVVACHKDHLLFVYTHEINSVMFVAAHYAQLEEEEKKGKFSSFNICTTKSIELVIPT